MADAAGRRRRIRRLQKYALNPPMKLATHLGLVPGHVVIETTGRRTGARRRTVVGACQQGDTFWVVAEQGRHAGYVANLIADPNVRIRHRGRWLAATATPEPQDDPRQRLQQFPASHRRAVTSFGTDLLTIRLTVEPEPKGRWSTALHPSGELSPT